MEKSYSEFFRETSITFNQILCDIRPYVFGQANIHQKGWISNNDNIHYIPNKNATLSYKMT